MGHYKQYSRARYLGGCGFSWAARKGEGEKLCPRCGRTNIAIYFSILGAVNSGDMEFEVFFKPYGF